MSCSDHLHVSPQDVAWRALPPGSPSRSPVRAGCCCFRPPRAPGFLYQGKACVEVSPRGIRDTDLTCAAQRTVPQMSRLLPHQGDSPALTSTPSVSSACFCTLREYNHLRSPLCVRLLSRCVQIMSWRRLAKGFFSLLCTVSLLPLVSLWVMSNILVINEQDCYEHSSSCLSGHTRTHFCWVRTQREEWICWVTG